MTILAFDVSKNELVGVRADRHGNVREQFAFPNRETDISVRLGEWQARYPRLLVGSEATAEYHRPLTEWCVANGVPFRLLNPILTKQFTRATIRKKKTDQSDAAIIARLLAQGEGTTQSTELLRPTKTLNRTAHSLLTLQKTIKAIARHTEQIGAREPSIVAALQKPQTALAEAVRLLRGLVREQTDRELQRLLMSIPGIGVTIASTLITEIGDITRFPSGKSLVAYAGLDPKVKQSGQSLHHNTKITKRGSPYLRQSLYIAAYIAARHDPELKEYWQKKTAEGKRYKEATVATARKMIYRVYAVWKRGTPYETITKLLILG